MQCVEEGQRVLRHTCHRSRHRSRRSSDTCVLEENDLSSTSQRIRHGGVPVIQRSGEVLKTEERETRAVTETAIGVALLTHFDKFRGRLHIACSHKYLQLLDELLPTDEGRAFRAR